METSQRILASAPKLAAKKRDRFFLVMSVMALILFIAGFFPTYILPVSKGSFAAKP